VRVVRVHPIPRTFLPAFPPVVDLAETAVYLGVASRTPTGHATGPVQVDNVGCPMTARKLRPTAESGKN